MGAQGRLAAWPMGEWGPCFLPTLPFFTWRWVLKTIHYIKMTARKRTFPKKDLTISVCAYFCHHCTERTYENPQTFVKYTSEETGFSIFHFYQTLQCFFLKGWSHVWGWRCYASVYKESSNYFSKVEKILSENKAATHRELQKLKNLTLFKEVLCSLNKNQTSISKYLESNIFN